MAITVPVHADTDLYDVQSDGGSNTTLTFNVPVGIYGTLLGTYTLDGSAAAASQSGTVWSSLSNATDGSTSTAASYAGTVSDTSNLEARGTDAPSSGSAIGQVQGRAYVDTSDVTGWTPWTNLDDPTWTWAKLQDVRFKALGSALGFSDVYFYDGIDSTALGFAEGGDSAFTGDLMKVEIRVFGTDGLDDAHLLILASGDDNDVTWTPPDDFTEWFELNGASGDDASIGAWYARASDVTASTVALVRSGGEELSGVLMVVQGADDLDFRDVVTPLTVETDNVDGSPNITPEAITTLTDGALVLIMTGNRSDSGIADTYMPDTEYTWVSQAVSGYTIPDDAVTAGNPGTAAEGAPGRVWSGLGNGDAQLLWMYKTIATAGTETPGQITGITGGRDHKTATLAIRAKPTLTQAAFRFRNDDGSETAATWMDALDTDVTLDAAGSDVKFRLRFLLTNAASVSIPTSMGWVIQFSKNGGAWENAGPSQPIQATTSIYVSSGDPTTEQLAGVGSFVAGKIGNTMVGTTGFVADRQTEHEFMLVASSTYLADADTIDLRVVRYDDPNTSTFSTYTEIPRITIGSSGNTYDDAGYESMDLLESGTDIATLVDTGAELIDLLESGLDIATLPDSGNELIELTEIGTAGLLIAYAGQETIDLTTLGADIASLVDAGSEYLDLLELGIEGAILTYAGTGLIELTELGDDWLEAIVYDEAGFEQVILTETGVEVLTVTEAGQALIDLGEVGVDFATLVDTGTGLIELTELGVAGLDLVDSGQELIDLAETGTDTATVIDAGTELLDLGEAGIDDATLIDSGAETLDLATAGLEGVVVTHAGTALLELLTVGYEGVVVTHAGAELLVLTESGVDTAAWVDSGSALVDLLEYGDWEHIAAAGTTYDEAGFEQIVLTEQGVEGITFTQQGVAVFDLATLGVDLATLVDAGYELLDLGEAGSDAVVITAAGVEAVELLEQGAEAITVSAAGAEEVVLTEQGSAGVVMVSAGSGIVWLTESGTSIVLVVEEGAEQILLMAAGVDWVSGGPAPPGRIQAVRQRTLGRRARDVRSMRTR